MPQNNINENQGAGDQKRQNDVPMQPQSSGKKSNRGFASMDAAKQREIASKGGRAAHQKGTAHQFTPEEARQAGKKGGGTVSQDRAHMAEIGRIGGQSRGRRLANKATPSEPPSSTNVSSASTEEESPTSESAEEEGQGGNPINNEYRH